MLQLIPSSSLLERPETTLDEKAESSRPFEFACAFFKISTNVVLDTSNSSSSVVPFVECFRSLILLSETYSSLLTTEPRTREPHCRVLSLVNNLASRVTSPTTLIFDSPHWVEKTLISLDCGVRRFEPSLTLKIVADNT